MDMAGFSETFFEEANEHLESMERLLLEIDVESPDFEDLNAIFRAAHSVKGGAATFGFEYLQRTTHIYENILDSLRNDEIKLRSDIVDLFLKTKDILKSQLDSYKANTVPDEAEFDEICAILNDFSEKEIGRSDSALQKAKKAEEEADKEIHEFEIKLIGLSEKDRTDLVEEIKHFGPIVKETPGEGFHLVLIETTESSDDIECVLCFIAEPEQIEIKTTGRIISEAKKPKKIDSKSGKKSDSATAESNTLRVPVDKIDQIINLVGELVITQSMLDQSVEDLDDSTSGDLINGMSLLKRNARDLQEAVMSIRMVPMEFVFSRFPRQVRDLAGKLDKEVELITEGKSTELDKSLVERIIDPLSHLVRNSLDHGIEQPEIRIANGKSPTGKLILSAKHQGGNIVIEVKDDGAGLNRAKLIEKAKSNGLPIADNITDDEVWQLIFAPGFSTAEVVTDVSGRGVGMDVVKRNIQAMGGSVTILSNQGAGTTTRITLPLTMAILDGMSVKTGKEVYILPLAAVVESLQPKTEDIYSMAGTDQVLRVRDEYLPMVYLDRVLQIEGYKEDIADRIAVIVQNEGKQYALVVDDLVSQQQVVVKNLETNFRKVPGISAATILGNGNVSLILDIQDIFKINKKNKK